MIDNRPIGMFDSGVGGLTVYKEIKKKIPNERIIYIGDTKRFPYGSKAKETIIKASIECINFLLSKNVKQIVIACGTATSQALDTVREIYKVPIEGIISPTVRYIKKMNYKNVGVIATRGTIKSNAWEEKIREIDNKINVYNKACPLLAPMAEEGWTDNEIAKLTVKEYLKDFGKLDALVLGCTHFPLYENIIKEYLPNTEIINTGKIIVEELYSSQQNQEEQSLKNNKLNESYLEQSIKNDKLNESYLEQSIKEDEFYLTDTECNFIDVAYKILGKKINIKEMN